jgi:hypothetical protein
MSDMNDLLAKLPEIRARRREISPAPWQWRKPYEYADWHNLYSADGSRVHSDGSAGGEYSADIDVDDVDAAFIAAAPSDIDTLLELVDRQAATIDRLLNDHEPHIAALEKRLAAIEGLRLVVDDKPVLPMRWWHLPEFGPFMGVDTEDQRDNSYGPFDTREEAQADWLKVINSPPPGEGNS